MLIASLFQNESGLLLTKNRKIPTLQKLA